MKNINEEKIKHGDLTKVKNTYAKALVDNKELIEKNYNVMSVVDYKNYITNLVKDNSNDTNAQRNFLLNVSKQRTKDGLLSLCWNAILKADNLEVI